MATQQILISEDRMGHGHGKFAFRLWHRSRFKPGCAEQTIANGLDDLVAKYVAR
jgi:hypothetical protein